MGIEEMIKKGEGYIVKKSSRGKRVYAISNELVDAVKKAISEKRVVVFSLGEFQELVSWSGKAKSANMLWTINGGSKKGEAGLTKDGLIAKKVSLEVDKKEVDGVELVLWEKEDK